MRVPGRCFVVTAGFPSPAEPWREAMLDLNSLLLPHPDATFFLRVRGNSMQGAGIRDGDVVIVDRALDAQNDSIIIAVLNDAFTVKRVRFTPEGTFLHAEHPRYPSMQVRPPTRFEIWGVVTCVIHPLHAAVATQLHPPRGRAR